MAQILIYVEDPGAANYVIGLSQVLSQRGCETKIFATTFAHQYLRDRGVFDSEFVGNTDAVNLLKLNPVDLLVVGTCEDRRSPSLGLTSAATRIGIPSIGIVDAIVSAEHRFQGETSNQLAYLPDHIVVPDKRTCDCFITLGVTPERVTVVDNPQLDVAKKKAHQFSTRNREAERKRLFESSGQRPVIVFLSELSNGLDPKAFQRNSEYRITGRGNSQLRTHIVLEELLDALTNQSIQSHVVLRLHPKEVREEYSIFENEIDQWSIGGNPLEILYFADLVVGMTTTLLLESHKMGVPVLSILPRETEREWLPGFGANKVPFAIGRQSVRTLVSKSLSNPRPQREVHPPVEATALERLAETIATLVFDKTMQSTPDAT